MGLIKVKSWVYLSDSGGFAPSPIDIVINSDCIIGVETRKSPYKTTGITNIMYDYDVNDESYSVELVVTDTMDSLKNQRLVEVNSFTSLSGILLTKSSAMLINIDFVDKVKTRDVVYMTTGITDVVTNIPVNSSFSQVTYIVKETADSLISGGGSGGTVNSVTGNIVNNSDPENPTVNIPIGTDTQFLGYVEGAPTPKDITKSDIGLSNVDNTSDANKPISTATSTALGLKVDKTTTVNSKPLSANVSLVKADIGLGNVDNTSDANKPVSTATTTALGLKVDKTTTVAGKALSANVTLVKGDVGLGNVDNTADTAKPISTAQQTALNLKSNIASPAFTGVPTAPTASVGTNTTQIATTAFVLANSSSSANYATSADFTINKVGSNFISTPRAGSGLVGITNTDAYTVIQDAITKLSTVGGSIYLTTGTYSLSNELTITGTSSDSPPTTSIAIVGSGFNTKIIQSTAGKNGIVVKNKASIIFRDFYMYASATAKSCIYLSKDGTSEVSVFGGVMDNLSLVSNSTTDAPLKLVNYFDLYVSRIYADNDANHGIHLINDSDSTNYGNSHFSLIRCAGGLTGTYAGLRIESLTHEYKYMNLNTFDNINIIRGVRGISIEGGSYNTFMHVDTEYMNNPIWIGGTDPNQSIGNKFLGGYLLVNESVGVGITVNNYAVGNKFNIFLDSYDSTVRPVNDVESYGAPNEYNLELSYNLKYQNCVFSEQSIVTVKDTSTSSSITKSTIIGFNTNRTLTIADIGNNKFMRATGGSPLTLTIPNDATDNFPVDSVINIISTSSTVTIAPQSPINLISDGGLRKLTTNTSGQLIKLGNNEWFLSGTKLIT